VFEDYCLTIVVTRYKQESINGKIYRKDSQHSVNNAGDPNEVLEKKTMKINRIDELREEVLPLRLRW